MIIIVNISYVLLLEGSKILLKFMSLKVALLGDLELI